MASSKVSGAPLFVDPAERPGDPQEEPAHMVHAITGGAEQAQLQEAGRIAAVPAHRLGQRFQSHGRVPDGQVRVIGAMGEQDGAGGSPAVQQIVFAQDFPDGRARKGGVLQDAGDPGGIEEVPKDQPTRGNAQPAGHG